MKPQYCVIVKTGDAELRAMKHLPDSILSKILPIVELTRGRGKKVGEGEEAHYIYPYQKKLEHIRSVFKDKTIVFDVTSDELLSSKEIDNLFDPQDGYANWTREVSSLIDSGQFTSVIPSIIMNYDDNEDDFDNNIGKQITTLLSRSSSIMYRCNLDNEAIPDDIQLIKEFLPETASLLVVVDCGWVPAASYNNAADVCIKRISEIKDALGDCNHDIIVCSTSFPNNVSEIGKDDTDTFFLREIDLFEIVSQTHPDIGYGDYGSINPVRNDQVVMARGWIPRIDVPLEREVYYYRKRRPGKSSSYANTYNDVAESVTTDPRFPFDMSDYWGYAQIINCSMGDAPSASPSFWISVRMNSHIVQQVNRLSQKI